MKPHISSLFLLSRLGCDMINEGSNRGKRRVMMRLQGQLPSLTAGLVVSRFFLYRATHLERRTPSNQNAERDDVDYTCHLPDP